MLGAEGRTSFRMALLSREGPLKWAHAEKTHALALDFSLHIAVGSFSREVSPKPYIAKRLHRLFNWVASLNILLGLT